MLVYGFRRQLRIPCIDYQTLNSQPLGHFRGIVIWYVRYIDFTRSLADQVNIDL